MTGHKLNIIPQGKEFRSDRRHQIRQIAVRMFPGANGIVKKYIANKGLSALLVKVGHMPL